MNTVVSGRAIVSLFCLSLAGAAHAADNVGAGPAGSAASAVGSIVTPGSHTVFGTPALDNRRRRVLPGDGGSLMLSGDQLTQTAALLRGFAGVELVGSILRAPTVLADGTGAMIALNTKTGELTVIRRGN